MGSTVGTRVLGLDGMRGIAVLLVVLFHVRLGPFGGGFVGVTVFFTLSGFLITSRTLQETGRTGGFSIGAFVGRRVRRLVPASVVCIAGTLVAVLLMGDDGQLAAIGGDTFAALLNLANWHFLAKGTSYSDLFAGPSPLNHYWSLAIEEQFYLAFPLVVAGIMAVGRRRRRWVAPLTVGVVALAASGSLAVAFATRGGDRFYYGSDARLFELLAGVGLALAVSRPRGEVPGVRVVIRPGAVVRRLALVPASIAGLVALVVLGVTLENGSTTFAHGGAQAAALLTVIVIRGLLDPTSPAARLCSFPPLVWVGKVSYGVYLYHWPIVALTPTASTPAGRTVTAVVQVAASLALAGLSWHLVERRISTGRLLPSIRSLGAGWAASTAVLLVWAMLAGGRATQEMPSLMMSAGEGIRMDRPVPTPPPSTTAPASSTTTTAFPTTEAPDAAPAPAAAPATAGATAAVAAGSPMPTVPPTPTAPPAPTAPPRPPLRVAVAGDSTAGVVARALQRYAARRPTELVVLDLSMAGCTVSEVHSIRHFRGEDGQRMDQCALWKLVVPGKITLFQPDVTVTFLAMMEQSDQRTTADGPWRNVTEPDWAERQRQEFEQLATGLGVTGAPGLWADVPYMKFQPNLDWVSDDPARTDALNGVIGAVAAARPDVELLPWAHRVNRPGRVVDTSVRPDGIHLHDRSADALVADVVLPAARSKKWP